MAHDVFISYSSQDKAVADAVCATLESKKIRCWIAPRDVPPGQPFAASLINAVKSARVMVLVLSEGSNQSQYVLRELNEAVDKGIPIIPFRIEEVEPSEELRFYIKSLHWLDAMDPPMERHLNKLADSVQALLSVGEGDQPPVAEAVVAVPSKKRSTLPLWVLALIGLAVVIVLGVVGLWLIPRLNSAPSSPPSPTIALVADSTDVTVPDLTQSLEPSAEPGWSDLRPLTFEIPSDFLWTQSGDGSYTALAQHDNDSFAWSHEIVEGDLILNLDITSDDDYFMGHIIVYGDAMGFSDGNLIFQIGDENRIIKHSVYIDEELTFLAGYNTDREGQGQTYAVTIEVIDDTASLFVDGRKVISAPLDDEVNRSGRIALFRYWPAEEVTFSNIQVKTRGSGD